MNALTVTATSALTVTATNIRVEHEAAQHCASEAVAHAIRCGELLIEAKAALPHGAFGAWLAANVDFSDRTARGYMQLAGLDAANRQRVADMSLRDAMIAIADKREPEGIMPTMPREEVAAMSPAARDAYRRQLLESAARNMQDILDLHVVPTETDLPHAIGCLTECERLLIDIGAASPPGQMPLAMMLVMQCSEIRTMLTRARA